VRLGVNRWAGILMAWPPEGSADGQGPKDLHTRRPHGPAAPEFGRAGSLQACWAALARAARRLSAAQPRHSAWPQSTAPNEAASRCASLTPSSSHGGSTPTSPGSGVLRSWKRNDARRPEDSAWPRSASARERPTRGTGQRHGRLRPNRPSRSRQPRQASPTAKRSSSGASELGFPQPLGLGS
jgi:hypothetical protein